MTNLIKLIPSIAAIGLLYAFAGQAIADSGLKASEVRSASTSVDASDLNLNNAADAQVLYTRIGDAARKLCRTLKSDTHGPMNRMQRAQCISRAIDGAVTTTNSPQLSAVHLGMTPERVVRR